MAESANQNLDCGTSARVDINNGHGQTREYRFTSPFTSVFVVPASTNGEVYCAGNQVYTVWCPSCSNPLSLQVLTVVPALNMPKPLNAYETEIATYATIAYVDESVAAGGGGSPMLDENFLLGLAGIICAVLIVTAFLRGLK